MLTIWIDLCIYYSQRKVQKLSGKNLGEDCSDEEIVSCFRIQLSDSSYGIWGAKTQS